MSIALNELRKLTRKPRLYNSDMIILMSQSRIVLEERRWQSKYPILNLYCNWTLHPEISGSMVAHKMLEELTEVLLGYDAAKTEDKDKTIRKVSNAIGLPALRKDFTGFFKKLRFPTQMFDNHGVWKGVAGMIISHLLDRPLEFPEMPALLKRPKTKAIHDSIRNKAKGTSLAVKSFQFFTPDGIQLYWKIKTTEPNIDIVSPVLFTE